MNMEYIVVPSILVICYILAEILKVITNKKEIIKRLIPPTLGIVGGILGLIAYIYLPTYLNANNIYEAIMIGILSGLASTGSNQIIKQILKGEDKYEGEFF